MEASESIMGRKDIIAKDYMSTNKYFADVVNFIVFDGDQVVDPDRLQEVDTAELVLPGGITAPEPKQKFRDVLKLWRAVYDDNAAYVLFGVENQNSVHYAMPVKSGLYDFMNYAKQVENTGKAYKKKKGAVRFTGAEYLSGFRKDDRLRPVITVVVYFGADEWNAPRALFDMFPETVDKRILAAANDYRINLISPAEITEEKFGLFATDLGKVMEYIKWSTGRPEYAALYTLFNSMDMDSARLANELTDSGLNLLEAMGEGGNVNMCNAIEMRMTKARLEGVEQGLEQGRKEGREEGRKEGREEGREQGREEGREQGREEGREQGRDEGILLALNSLVKKGRISLADAAGEMNMSEQDFREKTAGFAI